MENAPLLAYHLNGTITQMLQEPLEGDGGRLPLGQRHFDLGRGLGLLVAAWTFVGYEVGSADAAHAQGLIRASEVAIGSVEIVVRFLHRFHRPRSALAEPLLDRGKVLYREFHLNFEHDKSLSGRMLPLESVSREC